MGELDFVQIKNNNNNNKIGIIKFNLCTLKCWTVETVLIEYIMFNKKKSKLFHRLEVKYPPE